MFYTIPLVVLVEGNCVHIKNFDYSMLCGSERQELIDQHTYDTCGNYTDVAPSTLFNTHNKKINVKSTRNMKSMNQAYELKRGITKARQNELGLVGEDSFLNLNLADEKIRVMDLEYRKTNPQYLTTGGNVDDRLLGIMRNLDINRSDYGNRGTTPFRWLLFSYIQRLIYMVKLANLEDYVVILMGLGRQ